MENLKGAFWNFNLGHLITIALVVVGGLASHFKVDARVTAVEVLASSNSNRLERIDQEGTRKSQMGISQETELIRSHGNRIQELEKAVAAIAPKIERIDVNIQWIMTHSQPRPNNSWYQAPEQQQNRQTGR